MTLTRRNFLEAGAWTAAGLAAGCFSPVATDLGAPTAPVDMRRKAVRRRPGDRLKMAFVGVGGRGNLNLNEFCDLGEEVAALCDVDLLALERAGKLVSGRFPKAHRYRDWREMLERERNLDAVVVSTPDHMHGACAIAAMECGCNVYVETPLVRTWWEAERFREVAKACGVVTQMGDAGSAGELQRRGVEILRSSVLGTVGEIHVTTNRPVWPQGRNRPAGSDPVPPEFDWNLWLGIAPKRPYRRGVYQNGKWRGWFDFGTGALGDGGCQAMGFFWRGLDLREVVSVETVKTTPAFEETYPSATTVKMSVRGGKRKEPVVIFWHDGKTGPSEEDCRRITSGLRTSLPGTTVVGEKGVWWNGQILMAGETEFRPHAFHAATKGVPSTLPRVSSHFWEFAEAVRGGAKASSDIDHSVPLAEAVLLGCIAQRVPGRLDWNPAAGRFSNSAAANALLTPTIRHGWSIG